MSSLASKFYRSKPSTVVNKTDDLPASPVEKNAESKLGSDNKSVRKTDSKESDTSDYEGDWGNMDSNVPSTPTIAANKNLDGWEDEGDEWKDFDEHESTSTPTPSTNTFKTAISTKKVTDEMSLAKLSVSKTNQSNKETDDWENEESLWNEWGNNERVRNRTNSSTDKEPEDTKKRQDERRQQRNKNLEERKAQRTKAGPMRLGAKRVS